MSEQTTKKHEVIIKNGVAGVEINGRFYTHADKYDEYVRIVDVDTSRDHSYVASAVYDCEMVYLAYAVDLTPIPNPALFWPAGTKVMVRHNDDCLWLHSELRHIGITGLIYCIRHFIPYEQCKLAEAE